MSAGITYTGDSPELGKWFRSGAVEFDSADELFAWIDYWVADGRRVAGAGATSSQSSLRPERLTDLSQVEVVDSRSAHSSFVDARALEAAIADVVVGQDLAVRTMSARVREHLAQVKPSKPLALFAHGPSGTGKTTAAKRLAEAIDDQLDLPCPFLRIDMNEYREAHRVSQLLGAPAGYVGHSDSTPLIDFLSTEGPRVLLFDEFDKAHPDVFLTIMSGLDAGRLTTPRGQTLDCRRAIFIFTANTGVDELTSVDHHQLSEAETDTLCRRTLLDSGMKPELVGRMRSFLYFTPLDPEAKKQIGVLEVCRLGEKYGLTLTYIDPHVITRLLQHGSELGLGVRQIEYGAASLLGSDLIDHVERHGPSEAEVRWIGNSPMVALPSTSQASRHGQGAEERPDAP